MAKTNTNMVSFDAKRFTDVLDVFDFTIGSFAKKMWLSFSESTLRRACKLGVISEGNLTAISTGSRNSCC